MEILNLRTTCWKSQSFRTDAANREEAQKNEVLALEQSQQDQAERPFLQAEEKANILRQEATSGKIIETRRLKGNRDSHKKQ